jgi:hypothetical protein
MLGCVALLITAPTALAQTGSIAGTVTEFAGTKGPLAGIFVGAIAENGELAGVGVTEPAGKYKIEGLPAGSYRVEFADFGNEKVTHQFYKDVHTLGKATPVAVTGSKTAENIDAQLREGGTISGTVEGPSGSLNGARVVVFGTVEGQEYVREATAEASGKYSVVGLPAGEYQVEFSAPSGVNLMPQFYQEASSLESAKTLEVEEEKQSENINAKLTEEGGQISGTVTDATSHAPLDHVLVFTENAKGFEFLTETNASGEYTLAGLASGSYNLEFETESGEYLPAVLTAVSVTLGQTTAGVNVALVRSPPVNTAPPVLSGTPAVGQGLSCSTGSWTGFQPLAFSYTWLREGSAISGATGNTYVVQSADQGHGLACQVTAENSVSRVPATSNTLKVPAAPPFNTVAPVLSGTPAVGQKLSCSTGTWTGAEPIAFTYTWLREGSAISGAIGNTYVVQSADQGHGLACQVTAENSVSRVAATSNALMVPPAPPAKTVSPPPPETPPAPGSPPAPPAPPQAPAPHPPPQPPTLASVSQSHSLWRGGNRLATYSRNKKAPVGTAFKFVLNQQAVVSFVFSQQTGGRKVKGNCVAQTGANRRKPSCKRAVTQGTLTFSGHSGLNTVTFQGRVTSSKRLPVGAYKLLITASNSVGERSSTRTLSFVIVR